MVVAVAVIVMAGASVGMVHAVPFTQVLVVEAGGCVEGGNRGLENGSPPPSGRHKDCRLYLR